MDLSVSRKIRVPVGDPKLAMVKVEKFLVVNVGEVAPDFAGETLAGNEFKLGDQRGKVVLIDFWATWCAPCVAEMPNVKKVHDEYVGTGDFVVIGISLDGSDSPVERFVEKRKLAWQQIVGGPAGSNPIARKYNVTSIPATFLIDRDGKVVGKDLRGRKLRKAVRKLFPKKAEDKITAAGT